MPPAWDPRGPPGAERVGPSPYGTSPNRPSTYDPPVRDPWFEADPALMPLGKLLPWTGQVLDRYYRRAAAARGLGWTSMAVLGVLAGAGAGADVDAGAGGDTGAVSHRELAARVGITPATLTPVVDALERGGELTRDRDPDDRRVVRLAITARGRERLTAAFTEVEGMLRERLPHPPPDQHAIVRDYLLAVLAAIDDGP